MNRFLRPRPASLVAAAVALVLTQSATAAGRANNRRMVIKATR